jgi:DNA-binding NtrC family response regulator
MTDLASRILSFPPSHNPERVAHSASSSRTGEEALLGPSPAIARVWSQIRHIAPHFRAVMLSGEVGTGAEAAARALHILSPVRRLPFVVVEPDRADEVLSASSPRSAFREGMAFLPSVERLSPTGQRALLRLLRQRRTPVRIVASSTIELKAAVSAGRFFPELAEALTAVRIPLPALRERSGDIPLLAGFVLHRTAERLGIATPEMAESFHLACADFDWPGNLFQLDRMFETLLSQPHPEVLTAADFEALCAVTALDPTSDEPPAPRMIRLDDIVQEHIRGVLVACHGNKLRAAEVLGISRSTLYRMLDAPGPNLAISMAG